MNLEEILSSADFRRAGALLLHANPTDFNLDGIDAVLDEVRENQRNAELVIALAMAVYGIFPPLATDQGRTALQNIIGRYAAAENTTTQEN